MTTVNAISAAALSSTQSPQSQTWTHQTVSDGSKQRFHTIVNGDAFGGGESIQPSQVEHKRSIATEKASWGDALGREALIRELNSLDQLPVDKKPAASLKVLMMSMDLSVKTQTVRDGTRNTEDAMKNMLHG